MIHPVVPLFLTRRVSEHSQLNEWPSVPFRRPVLLPVGRRRESARRRPASPTGPRVVAPPTRTPPVEPAAGVGGTGQAPRSRAVWAVVVTGLALFMASLDNLVVSTALPVIRVHLHAGLSGLEWTVNAYTLTFAVLLLSASALGERFGRRRVFVAGIALFTVSSAAAAAAPSIGALIAARALQGAGGAMIMPLSLTLLSAAVRPERRNAALGIWGAIGGTAVALGPLVGGAVTSGWAWQYIFWLNVPVGLALVPLARWRLAESRGSGAPLDLAGVGLVSVGLFGVVLGLVRGNADGWTSASVVASGAVGALTLAGFVAWELRTPHPMLDLRLFARRGFAAVNVTALLFSFGMFGSIFFLTQFLQTVQGYSPLSAGVRILPWTAVTMVLAPFVGRLAERWGGKPLVVTGLALQAAGLAWLALILAPGTAYGGMIAPFVLCGVGMTLFFVPLASVVLGTVPTALEGVASGTNAAFRELGGVLGIAALGAVFSSRGGYASPRDYVSGLVPAVGVGAAVVAVGALCATALPARRRLRLDLDPDRVPTLAASGEPVTA